MEDEKKVQTEAEQEVTETAEVQQAEAGAADEIQAALEAAVAQRDDYLDKLQRTQADFQNFKRRNATARTDGYGYAKLLETMEHYFEGVVFAPSQTAGATDDVIIVDLQKDVPQRIRMFVWVEGQDVDCTNVLADAGLMINLELAGSSR